MISSVNFSNPVGYGQQLSALLAATMVFFGVAITAHANPLAVDQAASQVAVTFTQMNVPVDAQFTGFEAQANFDPAAPADATATITIDTASFDFGPGAEEYNAEVRKAEWFDTDQHPKALFEANGAKPSGDKQFVVDGKLTIKGKTQSVSALFELDEQNGQWVFTGELPIKRLDYGLGADEWKDTSIVANDVIVKFRIVANKP